jgi:hypothetical protein
MRLVNCYLFSMGIHMGDGDGDGEMGC